MTSQLAGYGGASLRALTQRSDCACLPCLEAPMFWTGTETEAFHSRERSLLLQIQVIPLYPYVRFHGGTPRETPLSISRSRCGRGDLGGLLPNALREPQVIVRRAR